MNHRDVQAGHEGGAEIDAHPVGLAMVEGGLEAGAAGEGLVVGYCAVLRGRRVLHNSFRCVYVLSGFLATDWSSGISHQLPKRQAPRVYWGAPVGNKRTFLFQGVAFLL